MSSVHYRTCNLCEAMCGIAIEYDGTQILSIKGDQDDPISKGYICPKATALQDLHEDPDRLRAPVERTSDGWREIGWTEALDKVAMGISELQTSYGPNSVGLYLGNPNIHNLGVMLNIRHLIHSLGTHNRFSATSVDQLPHHMVAYHLFGHQFRIPVPDINRTDFMLILGANPLASNGSIMSVANAKQKIKDIQKRGGKVVVIDPKKTQTAQLSGHHHFIKPGSDVLLLLSMLHHITHSIGIKDNAALRLCNIEIGTLQTLFAPYSPDKVAHHTGIDSQTIIHLTQEFCAASKAVCYGRMGVSVQAFGLLSQYLIMLINIVTGRLDHEGGLMFASPAIDNTDVSGPGYFGKRKSRVRGLPDFNGEFPSATLAQEMLTKGDGQIKGLVTVAGNPVLSTPNGTQLEVALSESQFNVSIDPYINETTRHAHIILPPVSPLERDHYDLAFHSLAVHNSAKYSPALFKKPKGGKHDWEIFIELAKRLQPNVRFSTRITRWLTLKLGNVFLLKLLLRRKSNQSGIRFSDLISHPHGIDLGPLKPQLPEVLKTPDKKIHLNLDFYSADLQRVNEVFGLVSNKKEVNSDKSLSLIGRRQIRNNNSWLHNSYRLIKGKNRCTLQIHPLTANQYHISSGDLVYVETRVGCVKVEAEITENIMPNVISIPHGFGHHRPGIKLQQAANHAGVSVNDLTDDTLIDSLSGNAAVNGVPASIRKA